MKLQPGWVAAAALLVARSAAAQSEPNDEVTVRGEPSGNFSSRADERDSAREVTDAASLVEPLPGVHVRRYGADDSFTTLSIRGSSSTEVAIILAGVPLTGGADPSLDLASLPLWPGAVATAHRSFAPASLGPGSLGGTLVLEPPRANSPEVTDVWAAVGSFGEARLRMGEVRDLGGGARVVTALSASRSDNNFSYLDPYASTPGHDVNTTMTNAGHAAVDGLVSWSVPVRWNEQTAGALAVTTLVQDRRQQLPGSILDPTPLARLESDRELASAQLTGRLGPGTWNACGWGRREGLGLWDPDVTLALGPTLAEQTIVGTGGSIGWRGRPGQRTSLDVRIDGSGERFVSGTTEGAAMPPGATRGSAGAGADARWRPTDKVTLAASGRVDGWSNASSDGTHSGDLRPTGHVGIETNLDPIELAAHAGSTARPPSFVELYGDRGAFVGDPGLLPESAWTVDAGVRSSRRFDRVRVAVEIVGFATWAQGLITYVPIGAYGQEKATNIGQARIAGVEADVRGIAGPVEVRASYTGLATVNESSCTAATGGCGRPSLPGRPANDFVGDAVVHLGPARFRAGLDVVSGIVADLAGSIGVPARVLASTGASVDVVRGVRLALDVRNLFDVRTGTYAGALGPVREPIGDYYEYPLPGRSWLVSARFTR